MRQRAALWRIRRYGQHQGDEPSGLENNSPNSRNSLSMNVEEQLAKLQTPAANDHLAIAVGPTSASANGRG
jgi:hypothetical protein